MTGGATEREELASSRLGETLRRERGVQSKSDRMIVRWVVFEQESIGLKSELFNGLSKARSNSAQLI
ncbi:hypothetical protein FCM35_KLT05291 [Carex littledalei]|uniref:Uncharacterized protein n=1 Tax=Carex littledalei TaxID=544730 RepID=A0A833QMS7_9POAL|nr:hypothetical protein FCM35_KLT05291 [Carex littledalei]